MRIRMGSVALAIALAGCSTPYQPTGTAGGFTESWRSKSVVVVDFKGNGFTSPAAVSEMALLRAAELAQAHGWGFFRIVGDADLSTSMYVPGTTTTTGRVNANGTFAATSMDNSFTAHKPGARIVVAMVAERDDSDPSLYDAQQVVARLGPKYRRH